MSNPDNDELLAVVAVALLVSQDEADELVQKTESLLVQHIREQRRLVRALPVDKKRVLWSRFVESISDDHFRRMFRMNEAVFQKPRESVCSAVGEKSFRPEALLLANKKEPDELKFISGEVKMALSIRMLAGGSCLDLVPLFSVGTACVCVVFETFMGWLLATFEFPLVRWLRERNWKAIETLANGFAEKTNGVFHGPFAALDGLAVRIKSPTMSQVADPGNCHCRKGFCALNVQGICDKWKRFLWSCPSNKGSAHDSAVFGGSRLVDSLNEMKTERCKRGLFIVGDSACGLAPHLLVPFDSTDLKVDPDQAKDAFNFHLSSCRIHTECAFGELTMRWGIFWRTLQFDLKKCTRIVQGAMLLHNFTIENRLEGVTDGAHFSNFNIEIDRMQVELTRETGEAPAPLASDNNELRSVGRKTNDELDLARAGAAVRERLVIVLATHGLKRPVHSTVKCNQCGHVHMTD